MVRICAAAKTLALFAGLMIWHASAQAQGSKGGPCKATSDPNPQRIATDRGTITIGCPKLWVSERIFTGRLFVGDVNAEPRTHVTTVSIKIALFAKLVWM
jgi:hypothetical protein